MRRPELPVSLLLVAALAVAACASEPPVTVPPATPTPGPSAGATAGPGEVPFQPAAWPPSGSACDTEGYTGRMGRIEAVDARTVRFTLCSPDGAFPARIADPSLAILDTATLERLAEDAAAGRSLAGTGPFRIDGWDEGGVILVAVDEGDATAGAPTVVLRWAAEPAQRTFELLSATVDGIDAPAPLDLERIGELPELAVTPRTGLSTAYLAFGNDGAFDDPRVRRAIAGALDRDALASAAFPDGSSVPTHFTPCPVPGGCAGEAWYGFNAPAAKAELEAAGFDLKEVYALHVPARPVAGLPDPLRAAEAIQAQLNENLGLDVEIDVSGVRELDADEAEGTLSGLYLSGVGSTVADPATFLGPVFGSGESGPATRTEGVPDALAEAAATDDPATREAAFGRANDAVRDAAAAIPLVIPGSVVAFRSDVGSVVTSPLGLDPLGTFTPGDRRQLVFMQATEPAGVWCGDQRAADAMRLCALVTDPLYAFAPGTLQPGPRLAEGCTAAEGATVWTCRLRDGVTFHDGAALDAGDVLATYAAQWDASSPLRAARPDARFAWGTLFGSTMDSSPEEPSPSPAS